MKTKLIQLFLLYTVVTFSFYSCGSEDAQDGEKYAEMYCEKSGLEKAHEKALDASDFDKADKLEIQIQELGEKMQAFEDELSDKYGDDDTSAEKAFLESIIECKNLTDEEKERFKKKLGED